MQSDVHYTAKNDFYVEEFMELKHQCSNCEFNFDGVCAGGGLTYGQKIADASKCCEEWSANQEYFAYESLVAPRFLREKFHDCSLSYAEFSAQHDDFREGRAVPINIFDAIKYVYGLSIVDIAVLTDVTYGVVYQAKTKRIPKKRIQQFCNALCITEDGLLTNSTSVFNELRKGKELLVGQGKLTERLSRTPDWMQYIADYICNECLHCPVHLAKEFARIDRMYWEQGVNIDEYTGSEKALIAYLSKRNKSIRSIEYFLDMAGVPHIKVVSATGSSVI